MMKTELMKIELLYWEECPSYADTLTRLREVLTEEGLDSEVEMVHVGTDDQAAAMQFPGSPTIRVDGVDLFPASDAVVGLTCRVYHTGDGRVLPLPTKDMIRNALAGYRISIRKGGM